MSKLIQAVRLAIDTGDLGYPVLRSKHLRFNAGMTKVYALICEDFLIYDSRVAAALGWLVVKYCEAHGIAKVPDALCFPWAAAKEGEKGWGATSCTSCCRCELFPVYRSMWEAQKGSGTRDKLRRPPAGQMAQLLSEVGFAHENTCRKVDAARPVLVRGDGHGIGNTNEGARSGSPGGSITVAACRQPLVQGGQCGR
ncbi:hypothetical protein [Pseudomonas asiatica]